MVQRPSHTPTATHSASSQSFGKTLPQRPWFLNGHNGKFTTQRTTPNPRNRLDRGSPRASGQRTHAAFVHHKIVKQNCQIVIVSIPAITATGSRPRWRVCEPLSAALGAPHAVLQLLPSDLHTWIGCTSLFCSLDHAESIHTCSSLLLVVNFVS